MNERMTVQCLKMDWNQTSDMGHLTAEHATQLYTLIIAQCPDTCGYSICRKQEQLSERRSQKNLKHSSAT